MTKAKKIVAIIGVICGIAAIIMGICILKMDCGNWQDSTVSFGGDFYTYSYKATAKTANNVLELTSILQSGFAYLLIILGTFESLYFGNLAIKAFESTEPASEPASEPHPEIPMDEPVKEDAPIISTEEI